MFILMVVIFVLGYLAIATEHSIHIDKAASALLIGVLTWTALMLGADAIFQASPELASHDDKVHHIVHELRHHLGEIAEILFFLLGAMTIVELIDAHEGFKVITDRITTTNKVKLLWVVGFITFFLSAALDNLTTTIVMISLLRKLIDDQKDRWFFAGLVVIAANAGGAWSPIGDVTTTMLWIGGQVTAMSIITQLIAPSLICLLAPLLVLTFTMKGDLKRPVKAEGVEHFINPTTAGQRNFIFALGLGALLFVPVFKTVTHLPPYMGMLFGLGVLWVTTEIMHRSKNIEEKHHLTVIGVLRKVDTPSVLFFLGILVAIGALQTAGHLGIAAAALRDSIGNVYGINIAIGLLSAIVDNVPLVAASMGMYEITTPEMLANASEWQHFFVQDGVFWEFLAYCAGTGGSCLIIGSAAGVAAMGMERIDFMWYLKNMSLLALIGYLAGAASYIFVFHNLAHG